MSYQVLARKWRPQNFKQMVGQKHVLQALTNALEQQRLHHAYLFTGTRGVGKTTIARILAKSLNCQTGITAEPCGTCESCVAIAEGRFVDLIEVDAASRTRVDDTRELLDNVHYAPTSGRFKVYLIDEVHMLSGHSFNALLKTLEEPPEHVKFLFATTDPQKLPVTILSRCLQFNLKRMPADLISGHMQHLLEQESIEHDDAALKHLAKAADGSMRDGLSLLDQAIAFGQGRVVGDDVNEMLGSIGNDWLYKLIEAAVNGQGRLLLETIENLAGQIADFDMAADKLISILHQLAVTQAVPDLPNDDDKLIELASALGMEDVQLFYQIALHGRKDMALAPDPRAGFEMLMLRIMAFRPVLTKALPVSEAATSETRSETDDKKKTVLTNYQAPNEHIQPPHQVNESQQEAVQPAHSAQANQSPNLSPIDDRFERGSLRGGPKQAISTNSVEHAQPSSDNWTANVESALTASNSYSAQPEPLPTDSRFSSSANVSTTTEPFQSEPSFSSSANISHTTESLPTDPSLSSNNGVSATTESLSPITHPISAESSTNNIGTKPADPAEALPSNTKNNDKGWYDIVQQLTITGRAAQLAKHSILHELSDDKIELHLDKGSFHLHSDSAEEDLKQALEKWSQKTVLLTITPMALTTETPAERDERERQEKQQHTEVMINADPFVCQLQAQLGAKIVPGSIKSKELS